GKSQPRPIPPREGTVQQLLVPGRGVGVEVNGLFAIAVIACLFRLGHPAVGIAARSLITFPAGPKERETQDPDDSSDDRLAPAPLPPGRFEEAPQRLGQFPGGSVTLARVLLQALQTDALEPRRNRRLANAGGRGPVFRDLAQRFPQVLP